MEVRTAADVIAGCASALCVALSLATRPAHADEPAAAPILKPVAASCVSSPFGRRVLPGRPLAGTFHPGVDLPAPIGAAVTAVEAGTIVKLHRRGVGGL